MAPGLESFGRKKGPLKKWLSRVNTQDIYPRQRIAKNDGLWGQLYKGQFWWSAWESNNNRIGSCSHVRPERPILLMTFSSFLLSLKCTVLLGIVLLCSCPSVDTNPTEENKWEENVLIFLSSLFCSLQWWWMPSPFLEHELVSLLLNKRLVLVIF